MAIFSYSALDQSNKYRRDTITAGSLKQATKQLTARGLSVITIKQEKAKTWLNRDLPAGISLPEKILFTRNLHTMMEAGINLDMALKTLAEQSPSERFRVVLADLQQRVQRGQAFHTALAQHPKYFAPLYTNLVKVGESSGKLDNVLAYLLVQQEKDYQLRTKIFNASLYPSIILTALLLMVSLMLVFVIPQIKSVLESYDVELPLQTRILVGLSSFLANYWYIFFPAVFLIVWLIRRGLKTRAGKKWWDGVMLKLPGFNTVIKEINLARLTRTLAATLKSGLSLDRSLELSLTVTGHTRYQQSVRRAIGFVRRGVGVGEVFRGYPQLYPPVASRMIEVGERAGKLDHMLDRLANFYENSVDTKLSNLSSVIEPLLILVIGVTIGYVAISVMTPIWSFSQTV